MATINFYLIHRDKTPEKTIKLKFFDKSSKGSKQQFSHSLPIKVSPGIWKPRIDPKTKLEKWLIETGDTQVTLNQLLRDWKAKLFQIRNSLVTTDEYGNKVDTTVEDLEAAYRARLDENGMLNLEESGYTPVDNNTQAKQKKYYEITIAELIDNYITQGGKEGDIVSGTISTLEYAAKHIREFQTKQKKHLTLNKLTHQSFNEVKDYLITTKEEGGAGVINSTARKYLSKIRDVMRHYETEYPHMHNGFFKGSYPPVDNQIVFALYEELNVLKEMDFKQHILNSYIKRFKDAPHNGKPYWTSKELSDIMQVSTDTIRKNISRYNFPGELMKQSNYTTYVFDKEKTIQFMIDHEWCQDKESLTRKVTAFNRVRDFYCFASEAPLRHSDLKNLNPKLHIREGYGEDGKAVKVVRLYPQKTIRYRVLQQFPLSEYCISILEKYKDEVPSDKALPIMQSNTKLNVTLHSMLRASGLFDDELVIYKGRGKELIETNEPRWSELSFHTSRHTFGTNMAAQNVNLLKIMRALGHAKLSTTQIYMEIIDDDFYSTVLNKYRNNLNKPTKLIALKQEKSTSTHQLGYSG